MCPLDLHHLMDAFRITAELSSAHLREIAVQQLGLSEGEVTADCQVSMDAARRKGWLVHEEQPVDLVAPEADVRNVPEDVPGRPHLSGARFMSFSRTQFWWPWNAFLCRVAVI